LLSANAVIPTATQRIYGRLEFDFERPWWRCPLRSRDRLFFPNRETLRRVWAHSLLTGRSIPCRVTSHHLWDLRYRQEHHMFDLAYSNISYIVDKASTPSINGFTLRMEKDIAWRLWLQFFPDLSISLESWSDPSHLGQDWLRVHFIISLLPCYLIPHYCSWNLVCICIGLFIRPFIICFYIKITGFYGCARLICIQLTVGKNRREFDVVKLVAFTGLRLIDESVSLR
jgi:hypothetical protein